jgi:hypothetical protein
VTTREAVIATAEERDETARADHLRGMTDEQVDAVLKALAEWSREVEAAAQQIYTAAVKAFTPLAAAVQKYRDAS